MQFSSIYPLDRALSGAIIPGQSRHGSNDNEGVFRIPQSSSITGTSLSDYLVERSYSSAEVQSLYSIAPTDWAIHRVNVKTVLF